MAVLTLAEAVALRTDLRDRGQRLVFTNGHFDLLHVGHLDYLEQARLEGDSLIVGINGDASTTALKGVGRPLIPASERARLIAALTPVQATVIFEELDANRLIQALQPEIYVKGGDYNDPTKPWPEREVVLAYGGTVKVIPFVPERSTSALITKIKALP